MKEKTLRLCVGEIERMMAQEIMGHIAQDAPVC